jgi:hypothetical protein
VTDPGAIDQHVEAASIREHLSCGRGTLLFIGHVERHRHGVGECGGGGPRRCVGAIGDEDARAGGGKCRRDRRADAGPGSGDQRTFVGEIEHGWARQRRYGPLTGLSSAVGYHE